MSKETFGKRLKAILDARGMNASDLAWQVFKQYYVVPKTGRKTIMGKEQMACYIGDRRHPSRERYEQIIAALGITSNELPFRARRARGRLKYTPAPITETPPQMVLDLPEPTNKRGDMRELIEALNRLTTAVNKLAN